MHAPGTKWLYGMGADWAMQFAVSAASGDAPLTRQLRASKKNLRELAKEKLTDPLGLACVPPAWPRHLTVTGPRI